MARQGLQVSIGECSCFSGFSCLEKMSILRYLKFFLDATKLPYIWYKFIYIKNNVN